VSSWVDARRGRGHRPERLSQDGYQSAAVCTRGHAATGSIEVSPNLAGKFCKDCGGEILTACPNCKTRIRGYYHITGVISARAYEPPNFCEDCGNAFPWMTERMNAASALADELDGFSEVEREKVKQSLADISRDGPATSVAVIRLKKWFGTASDAIGQALWKAAVEIGTAAAKKALLG
jgi:hypothetical protein